MSGARITVVCAVAMAATALAGCGSSKRAGTVASSSSTSATTPLPGAGRPPITVGDKNTYPEQFILGALYEQALAAKGFSVTLNRNIGPSDVRIKALESGSVAVYPEYIDVWNATIAGYQRRFASEHAAYRAGQRYAQAHGLELLDRTPFSDTDALGVTVTYAAQNGLRSIGDLRRVAPKMTVGGPPQFQSESLAEVEQAYNLFPAAFRALPGGEQYTALDQGTVQAADVNTTDGQLESGGYVVLADPAHVFGWGNVVPAASQKAIELEGPAFAATINAVSALLTTRVMRQLNAEVAVSHGDPAKVAAQFLADHNLGPQPSS